MHAKLTVKVGSIIVALAILSWLPIGDSIAQELKSIRFTHMFGELGEEPGEFLTPSSIDFLSDGRIVVFDKARIQVCKQTGECTIFGSEGSDVGQFSSRGGAIAIDSEDRIYLTDTGNNRVQACDEFGACKELTDLAFTAPYSIDVDPQDRVWIVQAQGHRIQVCDHAGDCSTFGETALLCNDDNCSEISFYEQSNWPDSIIVHVDTLNRVFVKRKDNNLSDFLMCDQAAIPVCVELGLRGGGIEPGQFESPGQMDSDEQGNLYIVDSGNRRIQICDPDTWQCSVFGSFGTGPAQFMLLSDLAVRGNSQLATVESMNRRVQLFNVADPSPFIVNSGLNGAWYNPETDGQGFFINVFPKRDLAFVSWFTYETLERPSENPLADLGEPYHRWLTAQGGWEGSIATLDVVMTSGGLFDNPAPIHNSDPGTYGTITIEFHECGSATLYYDLIAIGVSGEIPISRILEDNTRLCEVMDFP